MVQLEWSLVMKFLMVSMTKVISFLISNNNFIFAPFLIELVVIVPINVSGKDFTIQGNFDTWWTNHSAKEFEKKTRCFVDQYSNFSMFGVNVSINSM